MSQIQCVELHASFTDHCKMPPTVVACLEDGTKVELVLEVPDIDGVEYEAAKSLIEAAEQKPWEQTGRCCSSYQRDLWTRKF